MWYASFVVLATTLMLYDVRINAQAPPPPPRPPPFPGTTPAPPRSPPPSGPPGNKCEGIPALKSADPNPAYDITEWVVARLVKLKDPASIQLDVSANVCSVFTYVDKCGGLQYIEEEDAKDPKIYHASTYGYYETTNSLVHYKETFTKESEELDIWSIKLDSMEDIPEDQTQKKEINPIPDPVLKAHQITVALVGADKEGKWIIYRSCSSDTTWVSFPKEHIIKEQDPKAYVETFKQAIDDHLSGMKIDPATVELIEMKMKFEPPAITDTPQGATSASPPPPGTSPPPPGVSAAPPTGTSPSPPSSPAAVPQAVTPPPSTTPPAPPPSPPNAPPPPNSPPPP